MNLTTKAVANLETQLSQYKLHSAQTNNYFVFSRKQNCTEVIPKVLRVVQGCRMPMEYKGIYTIKTNPNPSDFLNPFTTFFHLTECQQITNDSMQGGGGKNRAGHLSLQPWMSMVVIFAETEIGAFLFSPSPLCQAQCYTAQEQSHRLEKYGFFKGY